MSISLGLLRGKREVRDAGAWAGLLLQHILLLHFLNILFFLLSSLWGEADRASVKSLELNWGSHKFEGEEKVAVHC